MGFFDWVRAKLAPEMKIEPEPEQPERAKQFSTDLATRPLDREAMFGELFQVPQFKGEDGKTFAMDSACGEFSNNPFATKNAFITATQRLADSLMSWYASQGFIGYQACAIFAQQWLIDKACSMPAKDAARNGWKPTINDGNEESVELIARINELDTEYNVQHNLVEFVRNKRIFGVRIMLFVVESDDPDYYRKPFNPDGIKPGSYKGMSQIDPYWMTPLMGEDSIKDPSEIHFYEPTWWQIGGNRYHRSHLVIRRHAEVPDIIKPAYLYGGVPLTQQIFERIYAAERTANEAPMLAMTKRMNVVKADLTKIIKDPVGFQQKMEWQAANRDNYGMKVIDSEEDYTQHETSLADLDATIMTQYQLVAAIAEVPATKLLGTSPKGFGASGDYEIESYRELLAGLQCNDMTPILDRHYLLLSRSEFGGKYQIRPVWNPLDEPSEKEQAETNKVKADTYAQLQQTGAIDGQDIREAIVKDPQSGFAGLTDDLGEDEEDDEFETSPGAE